MSQFQTDVVSKGQEVEIRAEEKQVWNKLGPLHAIDTLNGSDLGDLESIVEDIINQRIDFVKERGLGAMGPLMGIVMQAAGAADGKAVSALIRAAIQRVME